MKVRTKLQKVGSAVAWVVVLPCFYVISVIMLAGFLAAQFLSQQED